MRGKKGKEKSYTLKIFNIPERKFTRSLYAPMISFPTNDGVPSLAGVFRIHETNNTNEGQ
jgi:hypothetical protein